MTSSALLHSTAANAISPQKAGPFHFYYTTDNIAERRRQPLFSLFSRLTCTSYFECFSVNVSTIYCFNPIFRLIFVRNWVLLYINENAKRWAQLSRSSYYRFTFLSLSFEHLVQNKQIEVLRISTHQTLLRGKTQKFQSFFMVS